MSLKMYGQNRSNVNLEKICHIVGVLGGKGGVGKSTVTVNLALALKQKGHRVGILDADVYGPSVPHLLGGITLPKKEGDEILPAVAKGVSVMSVAFFQAESEASVVRAPVANQIISQFLEKILWGELDILLIDFPPGTGDIQITLMQKAKLTGALVVTTPQEIALLDVRKSIQMCYRMEVPVIGVVENMSYFLHQKERCVLFGAGGGKLLADEFNTALLGQIPIDPELSQLGDEGTSLFETDAMSRISFEEIAERFESFLKKGQMQEWTLICLKKKNQTHFEIKWWDGLIQEFRFSDLQMQCPCVRCKQKSEKKINTQVGASELKCVGSYGVQIQFTEGCSKGVYPYTLLRKVGV